jgi:predicted ABC-type ATPase
MSAIYIIAGPPGIGKSTKGFEYIDEYLDILNEDEMRFRYKAKGYADYNEYSIFRVREIIRRKLIRNEDVALELNLGFPHQYEYALAAKKFNKENQLNVILFFTDSLQLCLDRAKIRHDSGRHLVTPEIIIEMYNNTIPLLKANFGSIDNLRLIDATRQNDFLTVAEYNKEAKTLELRGQNPDWFKNDLRPFIEQCFQDQRPPN